MGLDVTYKGSQIAQLTEDGNLTLETAGKYCEDNIELSYTGGGGTISDGIVVTQRNESGYATAAELYASDGIVHTRTFVSVNENGTSQYSAWAYLQNLSIKNPVTTIQSMAFSGLPADLLLSGLDFSSLVSISDGFKFARINGDITLTECTYMSTSCFQSARGLTSISAPKISSLYNYAFRDCAALKNASFPCVGNIGSYTSRVFMNCTALENVEFGSIGYAANASSDQIFSGCTQAGLTITAYTTGGHVATMLSKFRNNATNATIIIKASADTTYDGASYSAGDTILTSMP